MAKQEKEFDRSICFTYFGNYDRQIELVKEQCGLETAYEVYRAIVDYGLFKKEITDPKIRMLVGEATLDLIENSQKKRENSFGENIEQTQTIIDYNREHPEASQREIARVTGISQGKVNKVFKKYELKTIKKSSKDTDSDNVTDNDIDDDYDNDSVNVNVNVTQCHTKDASHDASLDNADAFKEIDFNSELKSFNNDDIKRIMKATYAERKDLYDNDELVEYLVREFLGNNYRCTNKQALNDYANYIVSNNITE